MACIVKTRIIIGVALAAALGAMTRAAPAPQHEHIANHYRGGHDDALPSNNNVVASLGRHSLPSLFIDLPPSRNRNLHGTDRTRLHTSNSDTGNAAAATTTIKKTRFRARVSYRGTPFAGWQVQPSRYTIQGEIEEALVRRFPHRRIPVLGAGRTDAGVHARGQAVHFDLLEGEIPFGAPGRPLLPLAGFSTEVGSVYDPIVMEDDSTEKCTDFCNELQHSMNRMLPLDIRLFNLQLAPYTWTAFIPSDNVDDSVECEDEEDYELEQQRNSTQSSMTHLARPWHAIQAATSKWYSYRFVVGPALWNPTDRFTRTHFVHRPYMTPHISSMRGFSIDPYALTEEDIDRLQSILKLYEGTHDFKAFGGALEQNEKKTGRKISTVRTVYKVELVKEPLKETCHLGAGSQTSPQGQLGFIGEEGNYRIDFLLRGALYKMVRNMVGTAMEVWLGRMPQEHLVELLRNNQDNNSADNKFARRDNPCKPAPPEGLTLECVYYDDNF